MSAELFEMMLKRLEAAWPAIAAIDWTLYGNKIVPYNDDGSQKWTGILASVRGQVAPVGAHVRQSGFLSNPGKSAGIIVTKFRLIRDNPGTIASIEHRNPDEGKWAGAILAPGPDTALAITGLPEIGDHLSALRIMRQNQLLSETTVHGLSQPTTYRMDQAMEYVGMNVDQFVALRERIFSIIQ